MSEMGLLDQVIWIRIDLADGRRNETESIYLMYILRPQNLCSRLALSANAEVYVNERRIPKAVSVDNDEKASRWP